MKTKILADFQIFISVPLSRSATREATRIYQFITNNIETNTHTLFHLWCKENLLSNQKVSKYYGHDCRFLFFCSLLIIF